MTDRPDHESRRLPDHASRELLALAAELDTALGTGVTIADLRRAALETGIAPEAFDAALNASSVAGPGVVPRQSERSVRRIPGWVRVCLFGVPDRAAAMAFYWLFVAALIASPALVFTGMLGTFGAVATALFLLFAGWSTSQAIKWVDARGWDILRAEVGPSIRP